MVAASSRTAVPRPPSLPVPHVTPRRFLVTGAGRSGTHAVFHMLRARGINVRHEAMGGEGTVSWAHAVFLHPEHRGHMIAQRIMWPGENSTFKPWLYAGNQTAFNPVVQMVRHPLAVLNSLLVCFCNLPQNLKSEDPKVVRFEHHKTRTSWSWVSRFISLPPPGKPISRAMAYWTRWNALIEPFALARVRVEDLNENALLATLQRRGSASPRWRGLNQTSVGDKRYVVGWQNVCAEDVDIAENALRLAARYGYLDNMPASPTCASVNAASRPPQRLVATKNFLNGTASPRNSEGGRNRRPSSNRTRPNANPATSSGGQLDKSRARTQGTSSVPAPRVAFGVAPRVAVLVHSTTHRSSAKAPPGATAARSEVRLSACIRSSKPKLCQWRLRTAALRLRPGPASQ